MSFKDRLVRPQVAVTLPVDTERLFRFQASHLLQENLLSVGCESLGQIADQQTNNLLIQYEQQECDF